MPNINITDSRKRDAVVKAENTTVHEEVRYVDADGSVASTRKVLKATVAHDYETLSQQFGDDPEKLGYALIEGDPEVDMERCGVFLWGVSKVYVTSDDGIVYRIEQTEKVRDTEGNVKETRPRRRAEANVDAEIPLTWTGRKVKKAEAIRRFAFTSKLQVVHVNGLTYDFLYGMARELESENSLMMIGGGSGGKDPLVFRRGSVPYRGFLEGRVQGDQYILLLHLSNMELKVPEPISQSTAVKNDTDKSNNENVKGKKSIKNESKKENTAKAEVKKPSEATRKRKESESGEKEVNKAVSGNVRSDGSAKQSDTAAQSNAVVQSTDESASVATARVAQSVSFDDLGVWLKSIRMGKYLELFVANEIDVDVLPELSDGDLKELEIPLGSRRRLLKAVSEADNLRAEVAMAVNRISSSNAKLQAAPKKKTTITKKKSVKGTSSEKKAQKKNTSQKNESQKSASQEKTEKKKKVAAKKRVKKKKAATKKS